MSATPPELGGSATRGKFRLVVGLLRPYQGWLAIILVAMLVETAMALAAPWPLKIVLDNVVGPHKTPDWLETLHLISLGSNKMELAALAALAVVVLAALAAGASYVVAHHDWKHSHPLDLSDEGVLTDLEKHGKKGGERLAVAMGEDDGRRRKKKH